MFYKLVITLLVIMLWSSAAAALTPNHALKNTWHSSEDAKQRGYPDTIVINNFGKAKIGSALCSWKEKESKKVLSSFMSDDIVINCQGMKIIKMELYSNFKGEKSQNNALINFGETMRMKNCVEEPSYPVKEIPKNSCWINITVHYYTKEGLVEQKRKPTKLKGWGN